MLDEQFKLNHKPLPLPDGLLLLAITGIILGAIGCWYTVNGWLTVEVSDVEQSPSLFDEFTKGLPQEIKQQLNQLRADPRTEKLLDKSMEEIKHIFPQRPLYDTASFLLSLLGLIAGIGILMRRDWGRQLEIWFIVSATVTLAVSGYYILPDLARVIYTLYSGMGLDVNQENMVATFLRVWTLVVITFVILHAGIVYYLMRPRVRAAFQPVSKSVGDSSLR